jgi:hypothetical protein
VARTLSQDLRDRGVAALDGGLHYRIAAARFGIGISIAIRSQQLVLEHGHGKATTQIAGL